jgi:hypothetical protein
MFETAKGDFYSAYHLEKLDRCAGPEPRIIMHPVAAQKENGKADEGKERGQGIKAK